MYSPRTAAQNLLLTIAQKKRKAHLPPLMAHIAGALSAYDTAARAAATAGGAAVPPALARGMDGALLAIGTCAEVLKHKAPYKGNVEAMLSQFVAPCFDSPHGHLRAKACWVVKEFCDFEFSDSGGESGRGAQFCSLFERVMRSLADPDLPVRVDAVVALRSFVDALADLDILKPLLPRLLDSIFGLMAEVDNEDLIFTLEAIVEKFGDDIAPYAVNMARQLTEAFYKYANAAEDSDNDDDTDTGAWVRAGRASCVSTSNCAEACSLRRSSCRSELRICSILPSSPPCSCNVRLRVHPDAERAPGQRVYSDRCAAGSRGGHVPTDVRNVQLPWPGRVRGGHGHGVVFHLLHEPAEPAALEPVAADRGLPEGVGGRLLGQPAAAAGQPDQPRHHHLPPQHVTRLPGVADAGKLTRISSSSPSIT